MHKVVARPNGAAEALPTALTTQILQYVPQNERLTQCSAVCRAWAAAAASATEHVEVKKLTAASLPSLQAWLNQHAGQLLSLQLLSDGSIENKLQLQLPLHKLTQLQQLHLQYLQLQLPGEQEASTADLPNGSSRSKDDTTAAGANQAAAATALRNPQQLELSQCGLESIGSLLRLTQAPQLTSLQLAWISLTAPNFKSGSLYWDGGHDAEMQSVAAAMPGLLQQLPQLSLLEVPGMPLTDAALQQIGQMQGLQEINMWHRQQIPISDLSLLPSSVTKLQLQGNMFSDAAAAPNLPEQLPQLTALLHLELHNCRLPPGVLGSVTQLQHLRLAGCNLLPAAAPGELEAEGTAALLDVLPQLARLQHLQLELLQLDTVSTAPERFSALTASTQLTYLFLQPEAVTPLRLHAVQRMFPPGRRMPLWQSLCISPEFEMDDDLEEPKDMSCMDSDDLASICRSCPALQWLDVAGAVQPGADLSVLAQLPDSCTSLLVGGTAFTDATASVLARLTNLEYLCWRYSPGFTDTGLEQLTALDLGRLYVYGSGLSPEITPKRDPGTMDISWQDRDEGSVPEQIDVLCDKSPVCAPARAQRYRGTIKSMQEDINSLRSCLKRSLIEKRKLQRQLEAAPPATQQ